MLLRLVGRAAARRDLPEVGVADLHGHADEARATAVGAGLVVLFRAEAAV
jgi:hypothetical protein